MNKKNEHKFNVEIQSLLNEQDIPEQLLPQNIALMIKQNQIGKASNITQGKNQNTARVISSTARLNSHKNRKAVSAINVKSKKRAIIVRGMTSLAACVAVVFGAIAMLSEKTQLSIGQLEYGTEVKGAENYADVYKAIQDVYVKRGDNTGDNSPDIIEKPNTPITVVPPKKEDTTSQNQQSNSETSESTTTIDSTTTVPGTTSPESSTTMPPDTTTTPEDTPAQNVKPDNPNAANNFEYCITGENNSTLDADILKTDDQNIYYINGQYLYVVRTENGRMTLISKIDFNQNNGATQPVEMYLMKDKLAIISNHTVDMPYATSVGTTPNTAVTSSTASSDNTAATATTGDKSIAFSMPLADSTPTVTTQTTAIVQIYDISNKQDIKLTTTYRQSGKYVSSKVVDNSLYIVTDYSRYQTKPLDSQTELDNYVPSYFINDKKYFVDATDISIPSGSSSTGYAIVGGLNVNDTNNPLTSIKAVLGNVKSTYVSENNLYLIGNLIAGSDNKKYSSVVQFKLADGKISFSAKAVVEGRLVNRFSINEYDNSLRIATTSIESKTQKRYTNIFILGMDLKPIGNITNLYEDMISESVLFDKNSAFVIMSGNEAPASVDLSDKTAPKQVIGEAYSAYLYQYSDGRLLGLSGNIDNNGNPNGLTLSMYDSTSNENIKEIFSISMDGNLSEKFNEEIITRKAFLISKENNLIGIPTVMPSDYGTTNVYYLFSYDQVSGFSLKGALEYIDIDQVYQFNRGVFIGDIFYALSGGRIVSAQLSDMKVIETIQLKD